MTNPQLILDRLTAWVEKQSSVGPAAFVGMLAEIEREVAKEPIENPEAIAIAQAEELARFCDKHGVDRETVARRIYP